MLNRICICPKKLFTDVKFTFSKKKTNQTFCFIGTKLNFPLSEFGMHFYLNTIYSFLLIFSISNYIFHVDSSKKSVGQLMVNDQPATT